MQTRWIAREPWVRGNREMYRCHLLKRAAWIVLAALLTACSSSPTRQSDQHITPSLAKDKGSEVVMFAMALMGSNYRFGGSNPESGFDCSGMVSYIYERAIGLKLPHSAAQMAKEGREVNLARLSPGHVGIYVGDNRFVHAPGKEGKIKISSLKTAYFHERLEVARTFLAGS
jgi:cell wall-associated NlpC family hydrolase